MFKIKDDQEYLLFLDTEFDNQKLVQVAFIVLKKEDKNLYNVFSSLNLFINQEVDRFFSKYTHITQDFINKYGFTVEEASKEITNFLSNIPEGMIISHGLKQDASLLEGIGINLKRYNRFCTYEEAKHLQLEELKLYDIAKLSGILPYCGHDAYEDCKSTILAFKVLKDLEKEK